MKRRYGFLWVSMALACLLGGLVRPALADIGNNTENTGNTGNTGNTEACAYWVAPQPTGSDQNPGTLDLPWATLKHAAEAARDDHCTVWFEDGVYSGLNDLERRFTTPTTFRAVHDYRAVLEGPGPVIELDGVKNMTFMGFELRHDGPGAGKTLMIMDRRDDIYWSEHVNFINNIIHDSYNNDLFKIHNGVRFVTIRGNVFYNQGDGEEHIDVNGVTDVVIEENIFFNDFEGSGRANSGDTKHYITIKDSNGSDDDQLGSERITVRRNLFLNWQGGLEAFVNVGNDGKPYYEASDVIIENNLMLGNSTTMIDTALAVRGAKNITFTHNTVVGDLPSRAYALRASRAGSNPQNRNLLFANNIWSDPSGTMGAGMGQAPEDNNFAGGNPEDTLNIILDSNLYWNGDQPIPGDRLVVPTVDDVNHVVADPGIDVDHEGVILPRWHGTAFSSGNTTIRQEFIRLVEAYARIPGGSPAVGKANPLFAPAVDILGRTRSEAADLGAYQSRLPVAPDQTPAAFLPLLRR